MILEAVRRIMERRGKEKSPLSSCQADQWWGWGVDLARESLMTREMGHFLSLSWVQRAGQSPSWRVPAGAMDRHQAFTLFPLYVANSEKLKDLKKYWATTFFAMSEIHSIWNTETLCSADSHQWSLAEGNFCQLELSEAWHISNTNLPSGRKENETASNYTLFWIFLFVIYFLGKLKCFLWKMGIWLYSRELATQEKKQLLFINNYFFH